MVRLEILREVMAGWGMRRPTLRDVEAALREVVEDPVLCEHCVGSLYGQAFRDREAAAEGAALTVRSVTGARTTRT